MKLRQATVKDLPELKTLFARITAQLDKNGISIWDDIYPDCAFPDDIKRNSLFVLEEDGRIISAFALCSPQEDEGTIKWENPDANGIYIYRLGVAPEYLRKGIGAFTIKEAERIAREIGGEYLRLLVVDFNTPAIEFYIKNGYKKAEGFYMNYLNDMVLKEYGYEIKL